MKRSRTQTPNAFRSGNDDDYPRPQFRRRTWVSLNGEWEFALDPGGGWKHPAEVTFNRYIHVPFAPETRASGIEETGLCRACWYRRSFKTPATLPGGRLILRFGAVDYASTVWINGSIAARHVGGYTPFSADISDLLSNNGRNLLVVHADDDPLDLAKPRGKQDWQLHPHSIWYPRTSGIWQTVWLEVLPETAISHVRWRPSLEAWDIGFEARINPAYPNLSIEVELTVGDRLLARDKYLVVAGEVHRRIALSDPGIDDYRNELLWSPNHPTLIDARLRLVDSDGKTRDEIHSYTALRSVSVEGKRILLNARPISLRLVLDQGYWPESGQTPPDAQAVRRDVELALAMGFNGVRCHQRVPDPRYLFWADQLGLLVWAEMPSAYRFTDTSVTRLVREWTDIVHRDESHPSIITWVPFNESWGVPDLPGSAAQRHYVQALYHLTKTLDPTRPVVGNDGWESVATDIIGVHDYDPDPEALIKRYGGADFSLVRFNQEERLGGRTLLLNANAHDSKPIVLTEFGGITFSHGKRNTWGYSRAGSPRQLARRYRALLSHVRAVRSLAGFCYTQFADTYQEANGLLYADRTPKFPLREIAAATANRSPGGTDPG